MFQLARARAGSLVSDSLPAGMMRTRGGVRITARPGTGADIPGGVVIVMFGMFLDLTADESHQFRDLLHDAEVRAAPGRRDHLKSWSEMFPEGRDIFYEGLDPVGFAGQMRREFGFDPCRDPRWGEWVWDNPDDRFQSFGFRCPPEHLDEVYGSGRWELGS